MRNSYLFTSESVSEGHPDKVADQISDAIVDLFLSKDPEARVACETMTTTNRVVLAGEIRGRGIMDEEGNWAPGVREEIESTVRGVGEADRLRAGRLPLGPPRLRQPPAPAVGAYRAGRRRRREQGRRRRRPGHHVRLRLRRDPGPDAGDAPLQPQDPRARWPPTATPARAPFLEPDAKSQVTLRFEDGKPAKATAIVVSTQHKPGYDQGEKQAELHAYVKGVVAKVLPPELLGNETVYHINPTGSFEIGGPDGDAGITGRKIIVDTYGGAAPHGGGAFSGKDPTKVDRSAAYAARYLAKNIVAAGLARRCTIQLAYAIGVSEPLSLYVDTHGTGTVGDDRLEAGDRQDREARRPDAARHPHASRRSTSRSTGRPPPTAISAASPRASSSRGRRPTWSTT